MHEQTAPKIRVLIRKRPLNKKELLKAETDIVSIQNAQSVVVKEHKLKVDLTPFIEDYRFNFDGAYDEFASNEDIYATAVKPLVDCAFDGAKVTCFAYGQTGSGKTHTMLGNGQEVQGLYMLAARDIFAQLHKYGDMEVWISFYQIYCGKLFDLLNEKNVLHAREDAKNNVNIVGLSETKINGAEKLIELIQYCTSLRVTSQNGTNSDSSRSHAILQIALKKTNKIHGKFSFIDLAGSQRAADHADQLEKQTRIDGAEINKSLLALKECIRALDQHKNHTPFRGSKLTMVLKDSFTGYCRTVMIGNIAPNSSSCENTLNTLKYADRVKELKRASKDNFLELAKVDQFERELMLPRVPPKPSDEPVELNNISLNVQAVNRHSAKLNQNPPLKVPVYQKSVLLQQNEPVEVLEVVDFSELSEKHDRVIERILQEEDELIREHERHINETICLTKEEMSLRNEAEKIGSNIEDYLYNLDGLLTRKTSSISVLRKKIAQIQGLLSESQRIEQQYSAYERDSYREDEEEGLFRV